MQIIIDLNTQQSREIQDLAESLAVQPEELAKAAVNDLLSRSAKDFQQAAAYVLQKNRELYDRLS